MTPTSQFQIGRRVLVTAASWLGAGSAPGGALAAGRLLECIKAADLPTPPGLAGALTSLGNLSLCPSVAEGLKAAGALPALSSCAYSDATAAPEVAAALAKALSVLARRHSAAASARGGATTAEPPAPALPGTAAGEDSQHVLHALLHLVERFSRSFAEPVEEAGRALVRHNSMVAFGPPGCL